MSIDFGFNPADIPSSEYELIAPGYYPAVIVGSELKLTKTGAGQFIEMKFQITEGAFTNRQIIERFNIQNSNETAQKIGRERIKALCSAVGKPTARNTDDIEGCSLIIQVAIEKPRDPKYKDSNTIRNFRSVKTHNPNKASLEFGTSTPPERHLHYGATISMDSKPMTFDDDIPF